MIVYKVLEGIKPSTSA